VSDMWDSAQHEREKRGFVETRQQFRMVSVHAALMFAVTWGAGWGVSALLFRAGLINMPLRYALSFAISYPVFFGCVRIWADHMRRERGSESLDGLDVIPGVDLGDGCFIFFAVSLLGFALATMFAWIGGPAMLLEVAFEVVFAGTLVKRMGRVEMVGDWARLLWLKTLPFALGVLLVLVAIAAWVHHEAPTASTFVQAYNQIWPPSANLR
jgi:hypothetical protein